MGKILITVLSLMVITSLASKIGGEEPCWGQDCKYDARGDPLTKANITDAVKTVDRQIKRVYWYYLRGANRLFQANIDTEKRFIHFFIYQNIVGTFLAIGSWDHQTQVSQVNTFVRLGNGKSSSIKTRYDPVDVNPFIISLRLKHGQSLIEIDEFGNIICKSEEQCTDIQEGKKSPPTDQACKKMDRHLRQKYWYYIRGASIVHQDALETDKRVYAVFTYVNVIGTFLVISSCDAKNVVQINTFVRLGAGSKNPTEVQPVVIGEQTKVLAAQ